MRRGFAVAIVSHKTEYGHHDPERVNLREAALDWMTAQGFFERTFALADRRRLLRGHAGGEAARVSRDLACTHFIDDLEEVLTDPGFPRDVARILFSNGACAPAAAPYVVCRSWREIEERIFGHA